MNVHFRYRNQQRLRPCVRTATAVAFPRASPHLSMAKHERSRRDGPPGEAGTQNILLALGWYYPEVHRGVARFARDHGWHITADFDDPIPSHWKGDGVLTLLGAQQNLWRQLRRFDVQIVDLAESRPDIHLPRLTMDNAAIGRMAADHFLHKGYRNFAVVQRWELGVSCRRRDHFRFELSAAGHDCEVISWQSERGKRLDSREQRHRWLIKRLTALPKPMAVFAVRDAEAVEVIEACEAATFHVPEQVAVLGVDNTEMICDCLRVPLSSIDTNLEKIGYEGAALLQRLIGGDRGSAMPTYVSPAGIVQRRSTDSLAVAHPGVSKALRFIHDHAHEPIDMSDVVRSIGMSRSGLEKAFREHYIRSPMKELRQVRLGIAKKRLRESDESVFNIAIQSGFQSSHHLCRVFQNELGTTPGAYRREQAKP